MKNYLNICILGISFLIVIFIVIKAFSIKRTIKDLENKVQFEIYEVRSQIATLSRLEHLALTTENIVIDSLNLYFPNFNLSSIIIRLNEDICPNCYVGDLKQLVGLCQERSLDMAVLGSYQFNSSFTKIRKEIGVERYPYYNLQDRKFLPADSASVPFLFKCNLKGRIENVYFIQKNMTGTVKDFLDMIKRE